MKVLFLSSWFPNRLTPYNGDFVERHALAVSSVCSTAVVHVVADHNIHGAFFEISKSYKGKLYEVILYFKRSNSRSKMLAKFFNYVMYGTGYWMGYRLVRKTMGRIDVVHANVIFPIAVVACLIRIVAGVPYIISEHWTGYLSGNRHELPSGAAIRMSVKKAFALVPVTLNLQEAMLRFGYSGRYYVVPNVVDTEAFKPGNSHGRIKRLLHVSSMKEEHKNISGILRSIKRLEDIRDDFVFTFIGDVQQAQRDFAAQLALSERLEFKGELSHKMVAGIMHQSDILVMFSNYENLPCVILEALSCGMPVISSDVGGISEWIGNSNGILVKPGDEDQLLHALSFMMDHFEDYNRELMHQFAIDHFSPAVIAGKFLDIYKKALISKNNV